MTVIKCDMTDCKHNTSCCSSPHGKVETICTASNVHFFIDEEASQLECSCFEENFDKPVECNMCQMLKYGGIKINRNYVKFEE